MSAHVGLRYHALYNGNKDTFEMLTLQISSSLQRMGRRGPIRSILGGDRGWINGERLLKPDTAQETFATPGGTTA